MHFRYFVVFACSNLICFFFNLSLVSESESVRISIELMSAVAIVDFNGSPCGNNCNQIYITIQIEDEQVFQSERFDNNANSIAVKQTFVSESISVSANIQIELWAPNLILSRWKETAEVFASRGEQTLSGETSSNNRQNSLTVRAKTIKDGDKSGGMSFTCVS